MNEMNEYNYDGFNYDYEAEGGQYYTSADVAIVAKIFEGLSKNLGPKSGTDKLLILDTDMEATPGNAYGAAPILEKTNDKINYVFFQSYRRSSDRITKEYEEGFSKYIPSSKLLLGTNFQGQASDGTEAQNIARIKDFAKWQPKTGIKGGILIYAIDEIVKNERFNAATREGTDHESC